MGALAVLAPRWRGGEGEGYREREGGEGEGGALAVLAPQWRGGAYVDGEWVEEQWRVGGINGGGGGSSG